MKIIFAWYDLWIGFFWDRKKKWLYIFPIPCIGIIIKCNPKIKDPTINVGDYVLPNGKYPRMDQYFPDGPRKVDRVEKNTLRYTGFAFVWMSETEGYYINGLRKTNQQ